MVKGILFAILYAFVAWVVVGILAALVIPLFASNPEAAGAVASGIVFLFVAIPAGVLGFIRHRAS